MRHTNLSRVHKFLHLRCTPELGSAKDSCECIPSVVYRAHGLSGSECRLQHSGNAALVTACKGFGDPSGKRVAIGLLAYTDNEETGSTIYCLPMSYMLHCRQPRSSLIER